MTDKYVEFEARNESAIRKAFGDYMKRHGSGASWMLSRVWTNRPYVKDAESVDVDVNFGNLFEDEGDGY